MNMRASSKKPLSVGAVFVAFWQDPLIGPIWLFGRMIVRLSDALLNVGLGIVNWAEPRKKN